jgi:hypothetical protein
MVHAVQAEMPKKILAPRPPLSKKEIVEKERVRSEYALLGDIQEYSKGLYYFPATGPNFANKYLLFFTKHTNLTAVSLSGEVTEFHDMNGPYGLTTGYWVLTKEIGP